MLAILWLVVTTPLHAQNPTDSVTAAPTPAAVQRVCTAPMDPGQMRALAIRCLLVASAIARGDGLAADPDHAHRLIAAICRAVADDFGADGRPGRRRCVALALDNIAAGQPADQNACDERAFVPRADIHLCDQLYLIGGDGRILFLFGEQREPVLRAACAAGNGDACLEAAYARSSAEVDGATVEAACALGGINACYLLGAALAPTNGDPDFTLSGIVADEVRGSAVQRRNCYNGHPTSCLAYAQIYSERVHGDGRPVCGRNQRSACVPRELRLNWRQAQAWNDRACRIGAARYGEDADLICTYNNLPARRGPPMPGRP